MLTYVPSKVQVNILGIDVEGYTDGTFVDIVPEIQTYSERRALDGSTIVLKNRFQTYTLTLSLNQSSPANNWLHLLYNLFKEYNLPIRMPILVKDGSGTATFFSADCWFKKEPKTTYATTLGSTVWEITCLNGTNKIGGNGKLNIVEEIVGAVSLALSLAGTLNIDISGFNEALESVVADGLQFLEDII